MTYKIRPIYMCAVDYTIELGYGASDVKCYGDLETLLRCRTCWTDCGIVRIDHRGMFYVLKGSYDTIFKEDEIKKKLWVDDRRTLARKRDKL